METFIGFADRYGIIAVALLAFSEYLNLPLFPGGIACAAAGVLVKLGYAGLPEMLIILEISAIAAELAVYCMSYFFSDRVGNFCLRHERTAAVYRKTTDIIDRHGSLGLFTARLIPVIRTFVSIPAGLMKMRLTEFIPVSLAGNTVYALVNIALGYFLSSAFLS